MFGTMFGDQTLVIASSEFGFKFCLLEFNHLEKRGFLVPLLPPGPLP
jgi:hypothetical protein